MQIDGFIGVTGVEYFEFPKKKTNDHTEDHVLSWPCTRKEVKTFDYMGDRTQLTGHRKK